MVGLPAEKRCRKCCLTKQRKEFNAHKQTRDKLASWCRKCTADSDKARNRMYMRRYVNPNKESRKLWLQKYKAERGCARCKENDPICLDFNHINPTTKLFQISKFRFSSMDKLQTEIDKCEVLCANCHRKETARQRVAGSFQVGRAKRYPQPVDRLC
jgi:hypothetical protein